MFKINALGKACPLPVIEAHKALKDHDAVEITVDNEIATENLKNLSQEMNCSYTMSQESDTHYTVRLVKEGADVSEDEDRSRRARTTRSSSMHPSWASATISWARTCSRPSSTP